jgi:hypothetical protein
MTFVDPMKPPTILLFPLKDLNYFDAREAFLKESIHLSNFSTDFSKGISRLTAEEEGRDENQRKDRKGNQSQFPIEIKKNDDDSKEQQDVFEKVDQHRGEHFVDILYIVRQSRHQSSYRISIKKGDGEVLEVGKEFHPEAMHHPLSRHLHGIDLEKI